MGDTTDLIKKADTSKSISTPIIQDALANEIETEGNKLSLQLAKDNVDLVEIVKQIGKIRSMLARYNIQVSNELASQKTQDLESNVLVLVGTYKSHKAVWFIQVASTSIQIFSAIAGFGFMGQTLARGASTFSQVGSTAINFKSFFEESKNSQRTLMEFIQSETRRQREKDDSNKGSGMQEHREAVDLIKHVTDSKAGVMR